jgi:hypothetical protein
MADATKGLELACDRTTRGVTDPQRIVAAELTNIRLILIEMLRTMQKALPPNEQQ